MDQLRDAEYDKTLKINSFRLSLKSNYELENRRYDPAIQLKLVSAHVNAQTAKRDYKDERSFLPSVQSIPFYSLRFFTYQTFELKSS